MDRLTRLNAVLVHIAAALLERTPRRWGWRGLHVYARGGRLYVSAEPPKHDAT